MKKISILLLVALFATGLSFSQVVNQVTDTTEVAISEDTTGLTNKVDSLKDIMIELKETVSEDSAYIITDNGVITIDKDAINKPTGKNLWEWLTYVIFMVGILFVIIMTTSKAIYNIPFIKNSKNIIIQRLFAETSSFMKKTQILSASIAGIGTTLLTLQGSMQLLSVDLLSIVQSITIVALAIAGGATLTSSKPEHNTQKS